MVNDPAHTTLLRWIPLLPLPVGMGLLILQYIAEIMKLLIGEDDAAPGGAHSLAR